MHPRDQYVELVEQLVTPKQHVIRWIDRVRRFHRYGDYCQDQVRKRPGEQDYAVMLRSISESIDQRMTGADRKDHALERKKALRDVVFLRSLVFGLNETLDQFLLAARPEGAARARRLESVIARVEYARDAERAVALLDGQPTGAANKGGKRRDAERRSVIELLNMRCLGASADATLDEAQRTFRELSLLSVLQKIHEIRAAVRALVRQAHVHQLVGESIARTYFARHSIFYPENERRLATMAKWMEVVAGEYNTFICHRIAHLIDDEPEIPRSIASGPCNDDRCTGLVRVREEAAALYPERLSQLRRTALGRALLAIGEKKEGARILMSETEDDHPRSIGGEPRWM